MTQVDVLNKDSTDPNALARDRDVSTTRDATSGQGTGSGLVASTNPLTPELILPQIETDEEIEPQQVIPDDPSFNVEESQVGARVYPHIPAHIVNPTALDLDLGNSMGDQNLLNQVLSQSGSFALEDEIRLSQQSASALNAGRSFGPQQPVFQEPVIRLPENPFPQLIEDAIEYRASQSANQITPFALNSDGEVVPGVRNAVSGSPLSQLGRSLNQFLTGDIGNEFQETLSPVIEQLPVTVRPGASAILGLGDLFRGAGAALNSNQARRLLTRVVPLPLRGLARPVDPARFTANAGNLAARALVFNPDGDPTQGQLVNQALQPIDQEPGILGSFANESILGRDVLQALDTTQGSNFDATRGQFGDFGNAGILSGFLWAANVPEGVASGALYELTNFAIDNFTSHEIPDSRVRLFDAFRGRDLGFMSVADEARYISFVGDEGLFSRFGVHNPVVQNAVGFVADVAWGGFTDFGVSVALRNIGGRANRAVARALPNDVVSDLAIANKTPGHAILDIDRVVNNAVAARRLDPLPQAVPDNISNIIAGTSRRLDIQADNVRLGVGVANIEDLRVSANSVIEALESTTLRAELRDIDNAIRGAQDQITSNLETITRTRQGLAAPTEEGVLAETFSSQLDILRNSQVSNNQLNRTVEDLFSQRRSSINRLGELRVRVNTELQQAVANGDINLNRNVIETFNTRSPITNLIPVIPRTSIEPSIPITQVLQSYRLDPNGISPLMLVPVRRTNEQLTELAKFHGLIPSNAATLSIPELLNLRSTYPTLLSRFGNAIDDNIAAPIKQILLNDAEPLRRVPQRTIIADVPATSTSGVPDTLPPLRAATVRSLNNKYQRLLVALETASDTDAPRLIKRIETIESRINNVIANSSPVDVQTLYNSSLSRATRPVTRDSDQLAIQLRTAESGSRESSQAARYIQTQLIDAEAVLEQQAKLLEDLPPLERTSLHNEVATRNNFTSDGVPLLSSSREPDLTPTRRFDPNADEAFEANQQRLRDEAIPTGTTEKGFVSDLPLETIATSERVSREVIRATLTPDNPGTVAAIIKSLEFGEGTPGVYLWGEFTGEVVNRKGRNLYNFRVLDGSERPSVVTRIEQQIHAFRNEEAFTPNAAEAIVDVGSRQVREEIPAAASRQIVASVPTKPPASLSAHIIDNGTFYHGTKSNIEDLSVVDFTKGSSVSNELGPGLYLTTDPELASIFARSQPAVDRVPNPSLRPKAIGDVHQVLARPGSDIILDADQLVSADSPIRSLFQTLVRDELARSLTPEQASRLTTTATRITRTRPYRDWFQSLRVNWNRLRPDAQTELVRFNQQFTKTLGESGVYGASHRHANGHFTLVVYNKSSNQSLSILDVDRFTTGTGAIEEQALNRYAADLFAHSEFNTPTTRANLAASALAVDQRAVDNLRTAAKQAYRQSLDDTENLIRIDNELADNVTQNNKRRIQDINRNSPDDASTQLRRFRGENNSPCI